MKANLRICSLEHAKEEGAGKIAEWAARRGHTIRAVRLDLGQELPNIESFDFLVMMGGAMNVYEYRSYPWLPRERTLVKQAIAAEKAVLHLVNHDSLHRGQVMAMIRQLGIAPPPTDLMMYYRVSGAATTA